MKKTILITLILLTELHSISLDTYYLEEIESNTDDIESNTDDIVELLEEIKPDIIKIKQLNHKQLKVQSRILIEMQKQNSLLERILKTSNN